MPAKDKTGPFGTGPVGRGAGPCRQGTPSPQGQWGGGRGQGQGQGQGPGQGQGQGQGWGRGGRGFGRGMGRKGGGWNGSAFAPISPEEEAAMLEMRISAMQARVQELKANDTPSE
ncbi:MAG: hypothetical protein P8Y67_06230 [Alphaproteobacteria bacterium]